MDPKSIEGIEKTDSLPDTVIDTTCDVPLNYKTTVTRKGKLLDLVIIIALVVLISLIEAGWFPQKQLGFHCGDVSISFPFLGDTISTTFLLLSNYTFPLVLIVLVEYISDRKMGAPPLRARIWRWYSVFLLGINVTLVLCEFGKVVTGELRPHFLATCAPSTAANCTPGTFIMDYTCTSTYPKGLVRDTFRSFPSGHTAISVFTSIFCVFYLHYRYNIRQWGTWQKPILISVLLLWGPFVGFSRIKDRRHHYWDVIVGGLMGLFGAVYATFALCDRFGWEQLKLQMSVVLPTAHRDERNTLLNKNENKSQSCT